MTSTLTAPTAARPAVGTTDARTATACPVELRALRSGARTLADALTGIALDAPCDRARQRAVLTFARLVLAGVRGAQARLAADDVRAAADRVSAVLPTFAHDVSAGAPGLATACAALAGRLDALAAAAPVHDHRRSSALLECERRFRAAGPARALVPWFLDAADPVERMVGVRDASPSVRRTLRRGEDRYARLVEAVRA